MSRDKSLTTLKFAGLGALLAIALLSRPNIIHAEGVTAIAGGDRFTCALTTAGEVKCWGANEAGQLGDGTQSDSGIPVNVVGLKGPAIAITAGLHHTCAALQSGGVQCWGFNAAGQLGAKTADICHGIYDLSCSLVPVNVEGLDEPISAVAAGLSHTCALTAAGAVKCWGGNSEGELGLGALDNEFPHPPTTVVGLESGVVALDAADHHTCAITDVEVVKCWGSNTSGQVGDGSRETRTRPVAVELPGNNVVAISAGAFHSCAVTKDGDVYCWGANDSGELGDGTTMDSLVPVAVAGLEHATGVSASWSHTCALTDAGTAVCWGENAVGQLGIGRADPEAHPAFENVLGVSNAHTLSAGQLHTCAVLLDQRVSCWGANRQGQLGNGTTNRALSGRDVLALKEPAPDAPAGDVNCRGTADSIDAALILQLDAALTDSLPCQLAGDVNGDRFINSLDVTLLLQFAAGLISHLPPR
jgi:alpha-tubulin suppressor-like RCC1 family protein